MPNTVFQLIYNDDQSASFYLPTTLDGQQNQFRVVKAFRRSATDHQLIIENDQIAGDNSHKFELFLDQLDGSVSIYTLYGKKQVSYDCNLVEPEVITTVCNNSTRATKFFLEKCSDL